MRILHFQRYNDAFTENSRTTGYNNLRFYATTYSALVRLLGEDTIYEHRAALKRPHPESDLAIQETQFGIKYEADDLGEYDALLTGILCEEFDYPRITLAREWFRGALSRCKCYVYFESDTELTEARFPSRSPVPNSHLRWLQRLSEDDPVYSKLSCIVSISDSHAEMIREAFPAKPVFVLPTLAYPESYDICDFRPLSARPYEFVTLKHLKTWTRTFQDVLQAYPDARIMSYESSMCRTISSRAKALLGDNLDISPAASGSWYTGLVKKINVAKVYTGISQLYAGHIHYDWTTSKVTEGALAKTLVWLPRLCRHTSDLLRGLPKELSFPNPPGDDLSSLSLRNLFSYTTEVSDREYEDHVKKFLSNVQATYGVDAWRITLAAIANSLRR